MSRVIALVPAFNEQERIGATVKSLLAGSAAEVMVIDDGSTDLTSQAAEKAGAEVLRLSRNRGKGGALNAGLQRAGTDFDILLLIDADTGETASESSKLVDAVENGGADMAIAILPGKAGTGGFGFVLKLARRILKRRAGFKAVAPLSGQRALSRQAVESILPLASGYAMEVAMTVDAARKGLAIVEVPAAFAHSYTYRDAGGFIHRGRQYLDILLFGLKGK